MTLLKDIKDQVLQRTGMEYANSASDSEWLAMINSSLAELYEILISKREQGYFEKEAEFTIAEGSVAPYPDDFKELISIDFRSGDVFSSVQRKSKRSTMRSYSLKSSGFQISPAGSAQGDYRISYIPRYVNRVSLNESIGDLELDNWHEYAVVDVAIKFNTKNETDVSVYMAQKQALLIRISNACAQRDANEPFRLTGTTWGWGDFDVPRRY